MNKCAFWIVSTKERYYHEAVASAESMAKHMPYINRILFMTEQHNFPIFDASIMLPSRQHDNWYLDSIRYFNIAYDAMDGFEQMLYLDTDTRVILPFPEVFEIMDRFDIAGVMGSRRITGATANPIPLAFPEFEIGVTVFRRNEIVKETLELWQKLHSSYPDIYGANDQRSFREALWIASKSGLKIHTMPCEYGLRWPFGVFVSLLVKILHGRPGDHNSPDMDFVEKIINEHTDMRVWTPRSPYWREGVWPHNYD